MKNAFDWGLGITNGKRSGKPVRCSFLEKPNLR
jgi:hypothetical protein